MRETKEVCDIVERVGSPGTANNYRVQLVYGGRQCRVLRVRRSARMHAAIAPAAAKVSLRREGEGGRNRESGMALSVYPYW
jgi:hypothetical protein